MRHWWEDDVWAGGKPMVFPDRTADPCSRVTAPNGHYEKKSKGYGFVWVPDHPHAPPARIYGRTWISRLG